ncbi:MAG TPA: RNA polymerase sigma factor [Pirellulales bacterium]
MAAEFDLTTVDLAERFRRGDENAAREVLSLFRPVLRAWLRKNFGKLLARDEMDDVIGDATVRACEAHGECRGHPAGWLSTIAYNAAVEFLRSISIDGQRAVHFADPDRWRHVVDHRDAGDDGERSHRAELAQIVGQALAGLSARQREVVISDYWMDDVPDCELAARLGVAESTIRSDRLRAKRELEEILSRLGIKNFLQRNSVYLNREANSPEARPPDASDKERGTRNEERGTRELS